jgi:hypothetical protein
LQGFEVLQATLGEKFVVLLSIIEVATSRFAARGFHNPKLSLHH